MALALLALAAGCGQSSGRSPVALAPAGGSVPPPSVASGGAFSAAPSLAEPRTGHSATLLASGKVLVAGGATDAVRATASAEVFDAGGFAAAASMATARTAHTATLLPDGRVLVAGGRATPNGDALASTEVFDPRTGRFSAGPSMAEARSDHLAVSFVDASGAARVLLAGGLLRAGPRVEVLASAEVYDATTGRMSPAGRMIEPRMRAHAALLRGGDVLIDGGRTDLAPAGALAGAERFETGLGRFRSMASPAQRRSDATAVLMASGTVLVAGGLDAAGFPLGTVEAFEDSGPGSFHPAAGLTLARAAHTATLLSDGRLLVAGGAGLTDLVREAEFLSGAATAAGPALVTARAAHRATLLADGRVLLTGGVDAAGTPLGATEVFDPAGGSFTPGPAIDRLVPAIGDPGARIEVLGRGFDSTTSGNQVRFHGTAARVISASATRLEVEVPTGATSGDVVVQALGQTSNGMPFTVNGTATAPLSVDRVQAPASATAGSRVQVRWAVSGASAPSRNELRWGTAPGQYTQVAAARAAAGGFEAEFTAPSAGQVRFVIEVEAALQRVVTPERTIAIQPAPLQPRIELVSAPAEIRPLSDMEVTWRVSDARAVASTYVEYGMASGRYAAKTPIQSGGPGTFKATEKVQVQSGTIYFRCVAVADGQTLATTEGTVVVTKMPWIKLTQAPPAMDAGEEYKVYWEVHDARKVDHTNVHWDWESRPGPQMRNQAVHATGSWFFGLGDWRNELTAPVQGTIYFRIHARADGREVWGPELTIQVRPVEIQVTQAPASVDALDEYKVYWEVRHAGHIDRTFIRWGTSATSLTQESANAGGSWFFGVGDWRVELRAPVNGTIYYKVVVRVRGQDVESAVRTIRVNGASVHITSQPSSVGGRKTYTVYWEIHRAKKVASTWIQWGTSPGALNQRSRDAGKNWLGFGDWRVELRAPDTGTIYFRGMAQVDGVPIESDLRTIQVR
ncbi:MAG: IPT/TIG domain-containing protein [Planctomycetes bacterium]|nr:IPT/TIG domain-containing protein [Planctomycetota bacterium]